jgi:hypothetical protein
MNRRRSQLPTNNQQLTINNISALRCQTAGNEIAIDLGQEAI